MTDQSSPPSSPKPESEPVLSPKLSRVLTPEARRALDEAEARRKAAETAAALPPEQGGRAGPEPVRYGDWENKGIASDF